MSEENKIRELSNSIPFLPNSGKGKPQFYKVLNGTVYQFAVESIQNDKYGARYEIAMYRKDEIFLVLPDVVVNNSNPIHFVLTGSHKTIISPINTDELFQETSREAVNSALLKVAEKLENPIPFDSIETDEEIRQYAKNVAEQIAVKREKDLKDEQERLFIRQKANANEYSNSLAEISSVFNGSDEGSGAFDSDSYIVRAATVVAKSLDIKLQIIPGKSYDSIDSLSELAKDSNVRLRSVVLRDKWYKNDNNSLLGFYSIDEDNIIPVALVPGKHRTYDCTFPQDGTTEKVNKETLKHLLPNAYMFYRPFDNEPISLGKLVKYVLYGSAGDVVFLLILALLIAVLSLLIPELTRMFMDTIIPDAAESMAIQISSIVLLCLISSGMFEYIKSLVLIRLSPPIMHASMDRILKLPIEYFKNKNSGTLTHKTMAVSNITDIIFGTLVSSALTFIFAFVYFFQLFRYSSYLLGWGIFFCIIPIIFTIVIGILKYHWSKESISTNSRIAGTLVQFLNGIDKLIVSASEKRAFSIWAKLFTKQTKCTSHLETLNNVLKIFTNAFSLIITMAFYGISISALSSGKMDSVSTGSFMAFLSSYTLFLTSLINTSMVFSQSIQILPMYKAGKDLLQTVPEVNEGKPVVSKLDGEIEINHVSFRYTPGTPLVLKDVSMKIKPGEFVAIVGGSGSGKSTLVRILLGFEKPESGSVFYDSKDLASLDVGSVRRKMGVVLQNSTLMQGSIYTNITGSSALGIDDAWRAAEMAGLADDIRAMPMGMHTIITADGNTLSGGQRQRLIIARAVVRNPSILIFDEATSALDNKTQAQITKSLEELNVTRIVIAHRLSTIINADRIYVLNNGVIEECGTYKELMAKGGFFADLAKRQQV